MCIAELDYNDVFTIEDDNDMYMFNLLLSSKDTFFAVSFITGKRVKFTSNVNVTLVSKGDGVRSDIMSEAYSEDYLKYKKD